MGEFTPLVDPRLATWTWPTAITSGWTWQWRVRTATLRVWYVLVFDLARMMKKEEKTPLKIALNINTHQRYHKNSCVMVYRPESTRTRSYCSTTASSWRRPTKFTRSSARTTCPRRTSPSAWCQSEIPTRSASPAHRRHRHQRSAYSTAISKRSRPSRLETNLHSESKFQKIVRILIFTVLAWENLIKNMIKTIQLFESILMTLISRISSFKIYLPSLVVLHILDLTKNYVLAK